MPRKIKLIWDFHGITSAKTAEHHVIHLREFIVSNHLVYTITDFEIFNEIHAIAYMVVSEDEMISVRDVLRPHRGEIYEE